MKQVIRLINKDEAKVRCLVVKIKQLMKLISTGEMDVMMLSD